MRKPELRPRRIRKMRGPVRAQRSMEPLSADEERTMRRLFSRPL